MVVASFRAGTMIDTEGQSDLRSGVISCNCPICLAPSKDSMAINKQINRGISPITISNVIFVPAKHLGSFVAFVEPPTTSLHINPLSL